MKSRLELLDEFVLLIGKGQEKSNDGYFSTTVDELKKRLGLSTREEFDTVFGDLKAEKLAEEEPNPSGASLTDGSMKIRLTIDGVRCYQRVEEEREEAKGLYR